MATHSSVLAWRIPGMGEPGGLPSVGSHRVRHDWSDFAAAYGCWGFPGGSDGKESACKRETWVQSLGWEGPLEEGMATHPSVLAWRVLMDRGAGQARVHGVEKSQT